MRQVTSRLIAAMLLTSSISAMSWPLPEVRVTLGSTEMEKLRTAIQSLNPDVVATITGVYATNWGGNLGEPRATFETDAGETGPGYRRHRLGWCHQSRGDWVCRVRDRLTRVISDVTTTSSLPIGMPTELAIRVLEFSVPLINTGPIPVRELSLDPFGNNGEIHVSFGTGCTRTITIRQIGDTFEQVNRNAQMSACN